MPLPRRRVPHGRAIAGVVPRRWALALLLPLLLSLPATGRGTPAGDDLARLLDLGDIPGASLVVLAGDTVATSEATGWRNVRAGTRVDRQTVFEAASLSKTVFAYLVLRLVDRDLLALDVPLARYADYPRLAGDRRHRRVTARMCLSHTTGLPNWGTRFVAEPGTRFTYSGEGIRFLRKTVEAITGRPLEELARQEVFEPLGMTRSSYLFAGGITGNAATGHDARRQPQPRRRSPSGSAAASLHTTAADYARFVSACLQGEGLSPAMHRQMLTPQVRANLGANGPAARHVHWGLGWGLMDGPRGPVLWQWGDNGDTVALAVACPACGRALVYFANGATGLSIAHELMAAALPDHRPWCLEALDYQRYDGPRRVRWFENHARRALARGDLTGAARSLETLLALRPGHRWAAVTLDQVQRQLADRQQADQDRG